MYRQTAMLSILMKMYSSQVKISISSNYAIDMQFMSIKEISSNPTNLISVDDSAKHVRFFNRIQFYFLLINTTNSQQYRILFGPESARSVFIRLRIPVSDVAQHGTETDMVELSGCRGNHQLLSRDRSRPNLITQDGTISGLLIKMCDDFDAANHNPPPNSVTNME